MPPIPTPNPHAVQAALHKTQALPIAGPPTPTMEALIQLGAGLIEAALAVHDDLQAILAKMP